MLNAETTAIISTTLTVVLVLCLSAMAVYLLATAVNDRRQQAAASRDRRTSAERKAFDRWMRYYDEELRGLRAETDTWMVEREGYERQIARLEQRLEAAIRLDGRRVAKIHELENRLKGMEDLK